MVRARVSVNQRRAQKKFRDLASTFEKGSELGMTDVTQAGKLFARSIAPYDTGYTFRSIKKRTEKGKGQTIGRVFIDPARKYRPIDGKHRWSEGSYAKFDLVLWMHRTKGRRRGRKHITSGDPQFMYTTTEYMRGIAVSTVRKRFDQLLMRFK